MQITIKGHQIDVTPALRQHAEAKMERLTRHFDHLHELSIVLGVEKLLHKAEATIHVSGRDLHADAVAPDMYSAIDALADKLTLLINVLIEAGLTVRQHQLAVLGVTQQVAVFDHHARL